MSMFTVVPFIHELKGKQANRPPAPAPGLPLADHRARPAGPWPGPLAGWQGRGVCDSAAENLPSST